MANKGKAALNQSYEAFAQALQKHVKSEKKAIDVYDRLLTLQDPIVSLIAKLILDDERHHHAILLETAQKMGQDYWAKRAAELGGQIPEAAVRRAIRDVESLRTGEVVGAREMQLLAEKYLKSEDLAAQVVTTWAGIDSTKHEALLALLEEYLRDQDASGRRERELADTGAM